ncbi:MAG: acyltransferase domain-containing protein, partial [Desulfobacterales bacterium]|nr:acyltransferase domain-containing protein [Desulfobacterales bacterium]
AHFHRPNPELRLQETRFTINKEPEPMVRPPGGTRKAGVSCFGMGGSNVHMILEEGPREERGEKGDSPDGEFHALPFSANDEASLRDILKQTRDHFKAHPDIALNDVQCTLTRGRRRYPHRKIILCKTPSQAVRRIDLALDSLDAGNVNAASRHTPGEVVFAFSGQGSQHAGMGADLYQSNRYIRELLDEIFAYSRRRLGVDVKTVMMDASDAGRINRSEFSQVCMFALQYATASYFKEVLNITPALLLGHSIGQITAACLANVFDWKDGLRIARGRGEIMQRAEPGVMTAINAPRDRVEALLKASGSPCEIAVVNSDRYCVVAGAPREMAAFSDRLEAKGIRHRGLTTSHAYHSRLMKPAGKAFSEFLKKNFSAFNAPETPFQDNVTGAWMTTTDCLDFDHWGRQIVSTVRFHDNARGVLGRCPNGAVLFDIGPGNTLARLISPMAEAKSSRVISCMPHPADSSRDAYEHLLTNVYSLWEASYGHLRLPRVPGRKIPLPTYSFKGKYYWLQPKAGANAMAYKHAAGGARAPRRGWLYYPTWKSVPPVYAAGGPSGEDLFLLLVDDAGERADLKQSRVEVYDDGAALRRRLKELREPVYVVLAPDDPEAAVRTVVDHLKEAGGRRRAHPIHFIYFTNDPCKRGVITGPHLVAPQEYAMVRSAVIHEEGAQLDRRHLDIAASIERHPLYRWGDALDVREDGLYIRLHEPLAPAGEMSAGSELSHPRRNGVYIITGGLGRIGGALTDYLMDDHGANVVVTTRGGVDHAGAGERFLALGGIDLVKDWKRVLDQTLERFGRIDGIFHLAGLADLKWISETDARSLEAEFEPKIRALTALNALLDASAYEVPFVCLFSSLASVLGGMGMTGYSSANGFMDGFVEKQARRPDSSQGTRYLSINWDDWVFEYDKEQVMDVSRELHRTGIPPREGLRCMETILNSGLSRVLASTRDLNGRVDEWIYHVNEIKPPEAGPRDEKPIDDAPGAILSIFQEHLELPRAPDPRDNFFDIGGDSLLAPYIIGVISDQLKIPTPMEWLFKHPVIGDFTNQVVRALNPDITTKSE